MGPPFRRQFLEFCLPTLLAPGNVPALAKALPCRFVLMTSVNDVGTIQMHPAWLHLSRICETEIHLIDDLITDGNHSATITLAYARVVRETGGAMRDTCFIFLVSDYIVADGALGNVLARVQDGASGVLAGNFQIIAEEAIPLLRHRIDPASAYISLEPRELMQWSLAHLHPATVANIVNARLSHNAHTNRLFWRVDQNTLLGRFYLMHMIAIRPEITDFVVGASCDYSFIPEMCPSGNVTTLTDSDDYLVVEMQPRDHEHRWLRWGPLEEKHLADSLSEWTTQQHRENVATTLVFHAEAVPAEIGAVRAQADAMIERIDRLMAPVPQPYRHHHYWIGSIAAHRAARSQALSNADWRFLLGEPPDRGGGLTALLWRMRFAAFGSPPQVTAWHPRWPDYRLPLEYLQKLTPTNGRVLVVADRPAVFGRWLATVSKDVFSLEAARLLELTHREYTPLIDSFDVGMLFLREGELEEGDAFVERIGPLLKPGGHLMILATNDRTLDDALGFGARFAQQAGGFVNFTTWVAETHYVPATRVRWKVQRATTHMASRLFGRSIVQLPLTVASGAALALASYICNKQAIDTVPEPPRDGLCSSVFMILRSPPGSSAPRLPRFASRESSRMRSSHGMPPYDRSLELRDQIGLEPLGLVTNEIWHDDPRQLGVLLARYKFVAQMLADRHDVGELGCADAFGTRIVLQATKKVTVYDANPVFIEDVRRRYREEWPLQTAVHDILSGPLPVSHDCIYSLNALEHVYPEQEDVFARNLRDSLAHDHDVLIVARLLHRHANAQDGFPEKRRRAQEAARALFPCRVSLLDVGRDHPRRRRSDEPVRSRALLQQEDLAIAAWAHPARRRLESTSTTPS